MVIVQLQTQQLYLYSPVYKKKYAQLRENAAMQVAQLEWPVCDDAGRQRGNRQEKNSCNSSRLLRYGD